MSDEASAPIPAPWREWVAENLLKGATTAQLRGAMLGQGFSPDAVDAELAEAADHPYLRAGRRLGRAVAKREWLMSTLAELAQLDQPFEVERIPLPPLEVFIRTCYAQNRPVILTGAVDHWPALQRWNPSYLKSIAGDVEIEIQRGREGDPLFDIRHQTHRQTLSLAAYLELLESTSGNDAYVTARNAAANAPRLGRLWEDLGQIGDGYLNTASPYWRPHLWMGPAGTRTPLHHDLNNILFVQLVGRKRFTLIPPMQTPWVYNFHTVYSAVDPDAPDLARHPDFARVTPTYVEVGPGEVLFIPVGWWHGVSALTLSMSVGFVHLGVNNEFHHPYNRAVGGEPLLTEG